MKRNLTFISLLAIPIAVSAGCEHIGPLDPGALQPTFSSIQQNIFNTSCALSGCHQGANPPWGLDLSAGNSYGDLVGTPAGSKPGATRVIAGDADNSYLVQVLAGATGINVPRMPFGQDPLTADEINTIREWIDDGAENN